MKGNHYYLIKGVINEKSKQFDKKIFDKEIKKYDSSKILFLLENYVRYSAMIMQREKDFIDIFRDKTKYLDRAREDIDLLEKHLDSVPYIIEYIENQNKPKLT